MRNAHDRPHTTRRSFLRRVTGISLAGTIPAGIEWSLNEGWFGGGHALAATLPPAPPHALTLVSGTPRERGRHYGKIFGDAIHAFYDREIDAPFARKDRDHSPAGPKPPAPTRDAMLRYADLCGKAIRAYAPTIAEELEGLAEGADLRVEQAVLITLHEELYHRGVLPSVDHCTVAAAGPPDTRDGHTYLGQTWDWMTSVFGLSSMLLWQRPSSEGPSLLSYAYPGLWCGAGLNSAGLALCWTSAWDRQGIAGPRVGIPSYVLLTHLLYQESLDAAIAEARRATGAGWFMFVMADSQGRFANIEGSPEQTAVETGSGHMGRHAYGTRALTRTPPGQPVERAPKAVLMDHLLSGRKGTIDLKAMQECLSNHDRANPVCVHDGTIDAMIFDCSARVAYLTRGPACSARWKPFAFQGEGQAKL
jgi:isopenicillin-N N-acyltransferase-like protein